MPQDQMTVDQFGATVKKKYPQYASYSDNEIGSKMLEKYPQYSSKVTTTPTAKPPEKPGILKSIYNDVVGTLLAKPSARAAQALAGVTEIGARALGFNDYANRIESKLNKPVPTLFGIDVAPPSNNTATALKETAGDALKTASYLFPYGKVAGAAEKIAAPVIGKTLGKLGGNVASGVSAGYGFDVGNNLQADKPLSESFTPGAGTLFGGALPFVPPVLKGASNFAKKTAKFGTSQATGFAPETIEQVVAKPGAFSRTAIREADRGEFAKDISKTISQERAAVSQQGKLYEPLRSAQGTVSVPKNTVVDTLAKYGLKVDGKGKIITSAESRPMSKTDIKQIEDFIKQYGSDKLSNNAYFNAKQRLSQLSKYEQGRADTARSLARDLRGAYEQIGDKQIAGLQELDATYAPLRKQLSGLSKDYLNADGTLKDGAATKIANLNNKGREAVLERLEKVRPGIAGEIKVLRAIEDIENASGIKVGTYARGAIGAGALVTGNIPAAVAAVLSQPEIALQLLRGLGFTKQQMAQVAQILREQTNKLPLPTGVVSEGAKRVLPAVPGALNQ